LIAGRLTPLNSAIFEAGKSSAKEHIITLNLASERGERLKYLFFPCITESSRYSTTNRWPMGSPLRPSATRACSSRSPRPAGPQPTTAGRLRAGDFTPRLWHGLRLLAIDGSTARLPNTDDARATFGAPPEGSSVPLARFSRLYDVLNGLVIEADRIPPRSASACLLVSIATRANDLILYDRGYPAFWLFALHHQEQRRFCARMPLASSREVSAFVASGKNSSVRELSSTLSSK